tara:strand:- start:30627 stop:31298 length:672 start_codon:yes stop_codon:yes gene_type:complete
MKLKILDILNANVYLTNILTIPIIVLTYLIKNDIQNWKRKAEYTNNSWNLSHLYEYLWVTYFWITVIAFILSNMYHLNMFSKFSIWKQIGILDVKFSAPLSFIIMVLLIIMYYIYLHNTSEKETNEQKNLKKATVPIYRLGIFFIIIGLIAFISKLFVYKHNYYDASILLNTTRDQALWTSGHIFFHYMCYTGGLLIVLLYYIENKDIYRTINEFIAPNNTKD